MHTCQAGDRVNNYILERMVGAGSFAQVWKAKHHIFDESVAVKIPSDAQYVRNLQREGVAIHGLKHPNIVRALDMDPYAEPPYLIMEFVDGPTLREVISQYPSGFPGFELRAATEIMRGILSALAAAHAARVIHRDIKPANILLALGDAEIGTVTAQDVRVTDFGLGAVGDLTAVSMMQSGSLKTEEGRSISGTIAYMSPEQRDGLDIDQRSDIYSAGIVLFELLTGMRPQGNDVPSDIRTDLPRRFDDIFRRCYTRVEKRFASAEEVSAALDGIMFIEETASGSAQRTGSPGTARSRCPECGQRARPHDQFCTSCGQQLVEVVRRCPSCDAYAHHADRYCIMCGAELSPVD